MGDGGYFGVFRRQTGRKIFPTACTCSSQNLGTIIMDTFIFFVFSVNQHTKNVHNIKMQDAVNSECVIIMIIAVSHISRIVIVEINIRQQKQVFDFEHPRPQY